MARAGKSVLAAALAAGAMVAGMVPAQVAHAKEQPVAVVPASRNRRRKYELAKKPTRRKDRIRELEKREAWDTLTIEARAELSGLRHLERISRGRLGRRMMRRKPTFAERLVKQGGVIGTSRQRKSPPLRVDQMNRAQRWQLMRELGVRPSSRQWRKLRKADRRRERAA